MSITEPAGPPPGAPPVVAIPVFRLASARISRELTTLELAAAELTSALDQERRGREEALQDAGRLRARLDELEAQPEIAEAVRRLDAIEGGEPEGAHGEADELLLACVPAEVREAYRRLVERATWWAAA